MRALPRRCTTSVRCWPTAGTHPAGPGPHLVGEGRRCRDHQRDVQPQPAQANRRDPPQLDQARTWYEKAADGGNTNAMYNLGQLVTNQWDPPQGGPGPHLVRKRPQRRATARHFSSWRHRAYCCDATH
jgi:hypothetical protein